MKIMRINTGTGTPIEISVHDSDVLRVANVLEDSTSVVNFKVESPAEKGLSQDDLGAGGFTKWKTLNYPTGE